MRGIKTKENGRWKRVAIFVALLLLFGVLSNSVYKVYQKKKEVEKALAQMQAEKLELENRNNFLEDSLEKLKTKEGIEFEIRKKLNVAEAGEGVAIIVEEESTTSAPSAKISPWQKFKNFFTGLFE